jgi:CxxC motif-containing protein (DUF1111 family)
MSLIVRLSVPGAGPHDAPLPHPHYGDQVQNAGLMGQDRDDTFLGDRVPPEAEVFIDRQTTMVAFEDGEQVELREPRLRWGRTVVRARGRRDDDIPAGGAADPPVSASSRRFRRRTSSRSPRIRRHVGFNGRVNRVRDDIAKGEALGRFGWKANQPSLAQQIAAAYASDLGVTSTLYPDMNCPPVQVDCAAQPPGNQPELIDSDWQEITFWEQALAVPARRNVIVIEGARQNNLKNLEPGTADWASWW